MCASLHRSSARGRALLCVFFCLIWPGTTLVYAHGGYHVEVELLNERLAQNPTDPDLHYRLALAHASHDEWRLLLDSVDQLETYGGEAYPLAYLRGRAWNIAKRYDPALKELNAFIKQHPKHAHAHSERGLTFYRTHRYASAVTDFRRAIDLKAKPALEDFTALALAQHAAGQASEATATMDEGLTALGPSPALLGVAIDIETENAAWNPLLRRIDAMQSVAPAPEPWMLRRAQVLESAGRPEEARKAWQALLGHLEGLPFERRGTAQNLEILATTQNALGIAAPKPVRIPPAE